jgi:hypothetical protein
MNRSHPTFQSLFLHVLPGIVIFGFYVIAAPVLFTSFGVPRGGTILLGFMIVGMPLQLTLMKRQATAEGKKGIREVISFRRPQPVWLTIALVAVAFALAVGMLATLPLDRISSWLADKVFWWFSSSSKTSIGSEWHGRARPRNAGSPDHRRWDRQPDRRRAQLPRISPAATFRTRLGRTSSQHRVIYVGASLAAV